MRTMHAVKLLISPPKPVQPNLTIAILEIICFLFGNMISGITCVLALMFYSDVPLKADFAILNGHA